MYLPMVQETPTNNNYLTNLIMNEAIQALHPPRPTASRRRIRRASSHDNHRPSRPTACSPSTVRKHPHNPRFTELLLEHGEFQCVDYAVLASWGPSNNRTEGRLRICTRSIVFEPRNTRRGIIRAPFCHVTDRPSCESSSLKIATDRYFVMKDDNAVGPYRQIREGTEFNFEFLHSNPNVAESLVRQLMDVERTSVRYHHHHRTRGRKSTRT